MSTTKELIVGYVDHTTAHGEATEGGDSKRANRAYDALIEDYRSLFKQGDAGMEAIVALLDHPVASVRSWAAVHTIELDQQKAEEALEEVASGSGLVAFGASCFLPGKQ